jgi:hypothetical protein
MTSDTNKIASNEFLQIETCIVKATGADLSAPTGVWVIVYQHSGRGNGNFVLLSCSL